MDLSLFFVSFLFLYFFVADLRSYCRCACYLCLGTDMGAMVRWQLINAGATLMSAADVEAREQDLGEELNRDGFQWG